MLEDQAKDDDDANAMVMPIMRKRMRMKGRMMKMSIMRKRMRR